jgi:hypothetical protein
MAELSRHTCRSRLTPFYAIQYSTKLNLGPHRWLAVNCHPLSTVAPCTACHCNHKETMRATHALSEEGDFEVAGRRAGQFRTCCRDDGLTESLDAVPCSAADSLFTGLPFIVTSPF